MPIGEIIIWILLVILLLIFIALPLYLTAKLVDEDEGLLKALATTIILVITFLGCLWIIPIPWLNLIIAIFINLLVIKVFYDTDWSRALVMWIVTIIMAVVILIVVGVIFGLSLLLAS